MKTCWTAFRMCQSMFCALPCPCKNWDEDARHKMLLFLPLVGLEMGLLWAGLAWLCRWLILPQWITGAVLCAFPYLISGFIHLDGFMDVCDAVGSCRSLEQRREILKDPHAGSFGVIGCVLLILSQFAFCVSGEGDLPILLFIPVVSRCCSALAVAALRPMSTSQYAAPKAGKGHICVPVIILIAALAAGFLLCGRYGFALVGCMAGYGLALLKGYRSLEGMNGDISGFALCLSELAAVAVWSLL